MRAAPTSPASPAALTVRRTGTAGRARGAVAAALLGLGTLLQGCVGLMVELPVTEDVHVGAAAEELRQRRASSRQAAPAGPDALPREVGYGERLRTTSRGGRTTYRYRDTDGGACWHLIAFVPVPTPGCTRVDAYAVENARLVAASARRSAVYGFFCSPLNWLLPRANGLCDGIWGGTW